jgi:hypothetical protein
MMEVQTFEEIKELKAKIKKARQWARKHFNSAQCLDERLVDENLNFIKTFFVEFPDVDTMRVTPGIMGEPMLNGQFWFEYRLSFNPLGWQGKHPIWDYEFPLLRVE